jgi:NTE family protein
MTKAVMMKHQKNNTITKTSTNPSMGEGSSAVPKKKINLALQGGGAHGAFAWGVLDKFLEDGRVEIEGISGTSAGSMNAVVFASGMIKGPQGAREALHDFWKAISDAGEKYSMVKLNPIEKMLGKKIEESMMSQFFKMVIHNFSPYELNPYDFNPLKDVLEACVDFDELKKHAKTKLFIATTNVRTGKARVFDSSEMSSDVILASACLPFSIASTSLSSGFCCCDS